MESYIEACVESVLKISEERCNIYLLNDGSTDKTKRICASIENKYNNVFFIDNDKNYGVIIARNQLLMYVLEKRQDEWICCLDPDDRVDAKAMKRLYYIIDKSCDIDFIQTGFVYQYPDKKVYDVPDVTEGIYKSNEIANKVCKEISWEAISCVGSKIYRVDYIKDNNIWFNDKFKYNEDGGFALCAYMNAKNVFYLKEPLYIYNQRQGSSMHSYWSRPYETLRNVNDYLEKYFESNNVSAELIMADRRLDMAIFCLNNELFGTNKKKYNELFKFINLDEKLQESYKILKNTIPKLSKRRGLVFLMEHKCINLVAMLLYKNKCSEKD